MKCTLKELQALCDEGEHDLSQAEINKATKYHKIRVARHGFKHSPETKALLTGRRHSVETRKLMSQNNWLRGKTHTQELSEKIKATISTPQYRVKISESHKGLKLSLEQKAKISAANKGKKASEESKAKMSAAQKKAKNNLPPDKKAKMIEHCRRMNENRSQTPESNMKRSLTLKGRKPSAKTKAAVILMNEQRAIKLELEEKPKLITALNNVEWDYKEAALLLGIDRKTVYNRVKRWKLSQKL